MYLQKIIQELNRIRNIPNTITRMSELEKFNKTTYPDLLKKNKLQELDKIKRENYNDLSKFKHRKIKKRYN